MSISEKNPHSARELALEQAIRDAIEALATPAPREVIAAMLERALTQRQSPPHQAPGLMP